MRRNSFLWWLVLAYAAGLGGLAFCFRNALNADAVAYLRLASYYATGKWALAISGYWGPMASWIMAVFLKLGLPALPAARVFMCLSGLVFLWGCLAIYRAFQLPEKWVVSGAVLSAAAGVYWSVQFITPDLLLSGLIGLAVSRMMAKTGLETVWSSAGAGLLWGLAYLTKAVAFPLAVLATLALGAVSLKDPARRSRVRWRNVAVVLLVFGLVAAPWVLTLSLKYRALTFSTTPRISHTLTGPPDAERYHPFGRTLHRPEPGRITSWEEPSLMAYNDWSPFENRTYAWHQVRVLARNLSTCLALLTSLNVGWLALVFALAFEWLRRRSLLAAVAGWGPVMVVPTLLVLLYLPSYVTLTEQRFFYPAFPFVFTALGLWTLKRGTGCPSGVIPDQRLSAREDASRGGMFALATQGWWLAVLGAATPLVAAVFLIGASPKIAGDCAADLARRLGRANLSGPVAGSGMLPGGRAGLYVAFLLNQPWYGDEPHARPASFEASGARLVIVLRHSELAGALGGDRAFADLDPRLFADPAEAAEFPLKAFEFTEQRSVPNP